MKKFWIVFSLLAAFMLVGCRKNQEPNINPIPNEPSMQSMTDVKEDIFDELAVQSYINTIEREEQNKNDSQKLTYQLIYFNHDNIPDLVVSNEGYWVSLYVYKDGGVFNVIDCWPYGAAGNQGYEYFSKQGVIRNIDTDYAGAIITTTTMYLLNDWSFDVYSQTQLGVDISEDYPEYQAIVEAYQNYGGYYHNTEKITEEEYLQQMQSIDNENTQTEWLSGEIDANQMIEKLKQSIQKKED